MTVSRRRFLATGSLAAGGVALGSFGLARSTARAATDPGRFSLGDTPGVYFDGADSAVLRNPHESWQSIAFDDQRNRLYYAQPASDPQASGFTSKIRISYVGYGGGAPDSQEFMDFDRFGAGHGIGIEYVGDDMYIWMECNAKQTTDPAGWTAGTAICCVKWVSSNNGGPYRQNHTYVPSNLGTSVLPGSAVFPKLFPAAAPRVCCAIDSTTARLLVRVPSGSSFLYSVYALADVRASNAAGATLTPVFGPIRETTFLSDLPKPPTGYPVGPTFQGMTLLGNYAYILTGHQWLSSSGDFSCPRNGENPGDVYITAVDLRDPSKYVHQYIQSHIDVNNREPEGIAVQHPAGGSPRLAFGLLNIRDCSNNTARAMVGLYKDQMTQAPLG